MASLSGELSYVGAGAAVKIIVEKWENRHLYLWLRVLHSKKRKSALGTNPKLLRVIHRFACIYLGYVFCLFTEQLIILRQTRLWLGLVLIPQESYKRNKHSND